MGLLSVLEDSFGWIYFVAWSATFYPQIILIFKRGTTAGLSTDFMIINVVGYISYLVFTFSSYASTAVAESYKLHTGYPPQVDTSDVLFAGHGAIMCTVLVTQLFIYPPRTLPHPLILVPCLVIQAIVFLGLYLSIVGLIDWFNFLTFAGLVKVAASIVKHFPQVFLNSHRQSTVGWSFTMIRLDVVGGIFSMAQQVVRCLRIASFAPFTSNLAKTFLALESLAFDFYFIAQHTIWYTDRYDFDVNGPKNAESAPLL